MSRDLHLICAKKLFFAFYIEAQYKLSQVKRKYGEEQAEALEIYKCKCCDGYHLGHKKIRCFDEGDWY